MFKPNDDNDGTKMPQAGGHNQSGSPSRSPEIDNAAKHRNALAFVGFSSDARVLTASGPRPLNSIESGELVITDDQSQQPVVAVLQKRISINALQQSPALLPIVVEAKACRIRGFGSPATWGLCVMMGAQLSARTT